MVIATPRRSVGADSGASRVTRQVSMTATLHGNDCFAAVRLDGRTAATGTHRARHLFDLFSRLAQRSIALRPAHSRCHLFVARFTRRLQPFRCLHSCSGCFRLERLPGGPCSHWKAPPCHGAHPQPPFDVRDSTLHCRHSYADVAACEPGCAVWSRAAAKASLGLPQRHKDPAARASAYGPVCGLVESSRCRGTARMRTRTARRQWSHFDAK